MFLSAINHLLFFIFLLCAFTKTPQQISYKHSDIVSQINQIDAHINLPIYSLTKLSYVNLTKTSSKQLNQCIKSIQGSLQVFNYDLIQSVNIHEGDAAGLPAIVRVCHQYFTLNGYRIGSFWNQNTHSSNKTQLNSHFISSVKSEFTYFAELQWKQPNNFTTVVIKKLQSRNKKITMQQQLTIKIPLQHGQITSFSISFSMSLKLFVFATDLGHLLFYKQDGKLEHHHRLFSSENTDYFVQEVQPVHISIVKLNNHLAIFSTYAKNEPSQSPFLYTISTNGKITTLRKYMLPKISYNKQSEVQKKFKLELKYNDNNWNQFYLKIGDRVYLYEQAITAEKHVQTGPRAWYSLISQKDRYHIAGNMLIVETDVTNYKMGETFRFYYNLTSGDSYHLPLPNFPCSNKSFVASSSQTQNSQIICLFCGLTFQCFSIFANSYSSSQSGKSDFADYSKLRVPLIVVSIGIIIYVSVARGKKSKNIDEDKEEEVFMKQLEKKDKNLYEELKRSRAKSLEQKIGANKNE